MHLWKYSSIKYLGVANSNPSSSIKGHWAVFYDFPIAEISFLLFKVIAIILLDLHTSRNDAKYALNLSSKSPVHEELR